MLGCFEASATTSRLSPFKKIQIRRCLSKSNEPKKRLQLYSWAKAWNHSDPAFQEPRSSKVFQGLPRSSKNQEPRSSKVFQGLFQEPRSSKVFQGPIHLNVVSRRGQKSHQILPRRSKCRNHTRFWLLDRCRNHTRFCLVDRNTAISGAALRHSIDQSKILLEVKAPHRHDRQMDFASSWNRPALLGWRVH